MRPCKQWKNVAKCSFIFCDFSYLEIFFCVHDQISMKLSEPLTKQVSDHGLCSTYPTCMLLQDLTTRFDGSSKRNLSHILCCWNSPTHLQIFRLYSNTRQFRPRSKGLKHNQLGTQSLYNSGLGTRPLHVWYTHRQKTCQALFRIPVTFL